MILLGVHALSRWEAKSVEKTSLVVFASRKQRKLLPQEVLAGMKELELRLCKVKKLE